MLKALSHIVCSVGFVALATGACKEARNEASESQVQGNVGSLMQHLPTPPPLAKADLGRALKKIVQATRAGALSGGSSHGVLGRHLLTALAETAGMPRWQVHSMLIALIDPDQAFCGGANCGRVLNLHREEIDPLLDKLYAFVKDDPRFAASSLVSSRGKLLASLQPDIVAPKLGADTQTVRLSSRHITQAVKRVLGERDVTYGDLKAIKKLLIRAEDDQPLSLDELGLFPNLRSLSIAVWDPEDLAEVWTVAHRLDEIEIARPFEKAAPALNIAHLRPLATFVNLKKVSLVGVRIEDPGQLVGIFGYAKALTIKNVSRWPEQIDNKMLAAIGRMPHLRSLDLEIADAAHARRWTQALPSSVRDVRVSVEGYFNARHCGSLAIFKAFKNASSFTVANCALTGIGYFGQAVAWQHLKLERAFHLENSQKELQLSLTPELPRLLTFQSTSPLVKLDDVSRHEITVRLAESAGRSR